MIDPYEQKLKFIISENSADEIPGAELTLDLTAYLAAIKNYQALKNGSSKEENAKIVEAENSIRIQKQFVAHLLDNMNGALLLGDILLALKDSKNSMQIEDIGDEIFSISGDRPLVIESMDNSMVELIKNSMDSLIANSLKSPIESDVILRMSFRLAINESTVKLTITDNAGGFPESYLANFNEVKRRGELLPSPSVNKLSESTFWYFGGQGLGLRQLFAKVNYGYDLHPNKTHTKFYDFSSQPNTDIIFQNTPDHGAEVIISGPISCIPKAEVESQMDYSVDLNEKDSHFNILKQLGRFTNVTQNKMKNSEVNNENLDDNKTLESSSQGETDVMSWSENEDNETLDSDELNKECDMEDAETICSDEDFDEDYDEDSDEDSDEKHNKIRKQ